MKTLISLISIILFTIASPLYAAEELNYNIINLQADAARQVDNDVMVVIMSALFEANSAAEAAKNVNKMMIWAAAIAGKSDSIKSQTMNYQTRPLYKNKAVVGWTVNQQIRFESKDFESLSTLVGTLQEKLRVQSMQFEVSPDRQENTVTELITASLEAFGEKARLVTKTLGAGDYRIVNISVREESPAAPYRRGFQAEAMSVQQSSAPHVEAGDSRINVRVDGTVQLIF
jgi:predicted secreted protein